MSRKLIPSGSIIAKSSRVIPVFPAATADEGREYQIVDMCSSLIPLVPFNVFAQKYRAFVYCLAEIVLADLIPFRVSMLLTSSCRCALVRSAKALLVAVIDRTRAGLDACESVID